MPGACDSAAVDDRVVDRVQAGGKVAVTELVGKVVEVAQDVVGRQIHGCQSLHSGPELAHDRSGPYAVAHDVADDERHPVARQRDRIEPVAADLGGVAAADIPVGDVHAGQAFRKLRQHAALQPVADPGPGPVQVAVVDSEAGLRGELAHGEDVDLAEPGTARVPGDDGGPEFPAAHAQRDDEQGAAHQVVP